MKTNNEKLMKELDYNRMLIACNKFTKYDKHTEDLLQDIILKVLEMTEEKFDKIKNIGNYIYVAFRNDYGFKYSKFNVIKRNYDDMKTDIYDITTVDMYENFNGAFYETLIEMNDNSLSVEIHSNLIFIEEILDNPKFWPNIYRNYDRIIFMMYYKLGRWNKTDGVDRDINCDKEISSTRDIQKRTGIHYCSVNKTVNCATLYIQSILREKHLL